MAPTESFYTELPLRKTRLDELYSQAEHFTPLPHDWTVLVADIKGSTAAVANNLHNEVNLAATGCIVAVLNRLKKDGKQKVPYFFGGDGATFLIPEVYSESLYGVLQSHKKHVSVQWKLELVVGFVPVAQLYADGFTLQLAKVRINAYLQMPIVLGLGLKHAESLIKHTAIANRSESPVADSPDLEGMECRWEKIPPPTQNKQVVCLLVYCQNEALQQQAYREVLVALDGIFGPLEERQPITIPKLRLEATYDKIKREMLASIGTFSYRYMFQKLFATYFGKLYFKYSAAGKLYLRMTRELSETVMIDGTMNMIFAGTEVQIREFVVLLDGMERKGQLLYGKHTTHASIMSCYVQDRKTDHAHFIDGTEGGYTQAAEMLKSKLA